MINSNREHRNFQTGKSGKPENCDCRKPYHIAYQINGNLMTNSNMLIIFYFGGPRPHEMAEKLTNEINSNPSIWHIKIMEIL